MSVEKSKSIGCLGIVAYGLFIIGVFGLVVNFALGEHQNEDGEWITFDHLIGKTLFTLILGLIFYAMTDSEISNMTTIRVAAGFN